MKSIKKKIIVWTIVGVLIAITVGILVVGNYCIQHEITPKRYFEILEISYKEATGLEYEKVYLPSSIIPAADGSVYVSPVVNGDTIKIEGNIYNAVITPDKSKIVAVEKDGNLFITDLALSYRESIAKKADCLIAVTNEGVIYKDTKDVFHRYLFEDASNLSLGKVTDYVVSEQGLNIAFADRWGKVYILKAESDKKEKVGTYSESAELNALSDDGNTLVYADYKNDGSVKIYDNGKVEVFQDVLDADYAYIRTKFLTADTFEIVAHNTYKGDMLFVKTAEQKIKKIPDENSEIMIPSISFNQGNTSEEVYMLDSMTDILYRIDVKEGVEEQVISNVSDWGVIDNTLYYVETSGDLYSATLNKNMVADTKKIDSNVDFLLESGNISKRLYYLKDYDDYKGTLYGYEAGSTPVQIDSDVFKGGLRFSTDENTIYYLKNAICYPMGRLFVPGGDLMKYTWGEEESVEIADDVDLSSFTSDLRLSTEERDIIDNCSFIYKRMVRDGSYPYDGFKYTRSWFYYDGVENTVFLEEEVIAPYSIASMENSYKFEYHRDGTDSGDLYIVKEK